MLKDLNQKTLVNSATHAGAAVIGAAGSGAVMAFVPDKFRKVTRAAFIIGSIAVAAANQGSSSKMKPTTSGLAGIVVRQGMDLLQETLKDKYAVTDASTNTDKAIAGMIGLACPGGCQGSWQRNMLPALQSPAVYETTYEEVSSKPSSSFI